MAGVMIGVDPHKASHTAVAISGAEEQLARQLLSAGERVPGVQPELGARVRLPATGNVNENDPSDARSVAVAALRSPGAREVRAEDHAAVPKVRPERHRDPGGARTQVVCRLHAVLRAGPRRHRKEDHRPACRPAAGPGHAAGCSRGRAAGARHGPHRGPAPHRRPAA